jgi:hypothetical protein
MPTPPKPFEVLTTERKSHRTKAELNQRKQGEEALSSSVALKERSEVKNNEFAHKEFIRINKLLKNINKNDALYEPIINRYCMILAELNDFEKRRDNFYHDILELEADKENLVDGDEFTLPMYYKLKLNLHKSIIDLEGTIQQKRKMLLDIEKENIMTIASALRSIPKKVEKPGEDDPMANLLNRRRG